jgi:replicative DNA helicase
VGANGLKYFACRQVLGNLEDVSCRANSDTVPSEVWGRVRIALARRKVSHNAFAAAIGANFRESTLWKRCPSRARIHRAAVFLEDLELHDLATNDIFWDKIVEITSIGEHDVFDGTVAGTSNFVAQGISVHNSLEQDADMVILLNRPDAFERDDPRGGEADLILAKHRNGPTKTVTVAHQLHLSRFTNMAR